jgi:hypothetical protein
MASPKRAIPEDVDVEVMDYSRRIDAGVTAKNIGVKELKLSGQGRGTEALASLNKVTQYIFIFVFKGSIVHA